MAVDNSKRKTTPPRPNLPPEGQPWGRWVTDTLNELKLETGGVKREVISSNKNHNAQLQMSAQQKREIIKAHLMAEEALNIALAASGSTTIYFVAPETPEPGDIWYESVTGIWFRWVDDQWTPITDETLLEALEAILAQRIANDDKIRTFAQDTEPTGMTTEHVGDLWYDTDDKNKLYRWDGIQWVPIRDAGITEAQNAADTAQQTADDAKETADTAQQTADNAAGAVSQLETQVTTDLGAMQGRLDTAEGELDELETVTLPALNSDLGALDTALSDLRNEVDNIVIPDLDGINKTIYSTSAASGTTGYNTGDTWRQYSGSGSNRQIIGEWQFTGSAWNPLQLRNEVIANLDAGKIDAGFLDAARIQAGSIVAEKLGAEAVTAEKVAADAITGNKIAAGSITASDGIFANAAIQAADIASINADTITVGTLSGIHIAGVTIEGETSLSLTQGGNPLMETTFEGIALYPPGSPNTRTVFRTADPSGNPLYMGIVREERVGSNWVTRSRVLLGTLPAAGGDGTYTDINTSRIIADRLHLYERLDAYQIDSRKGVTHANPDGAAVAIQSRAQMDVDGPLEAVQGTFSRGTDQDITTTGQTRISLNTVAPGASNVDLATGGIIQPATPGVYAIEANLQFDGGSNGYWRNIHFRMNGEQVRTFATVASGSSRMVNATAILAFWDYPPTFEVYTSGGRADMRVSAGIQVSVTRIGG